MRVHININASDLDRSIAFYTRLFGTGPSKVRGDYANWRLDEPGLHLALVSRPGFAKNAGGEHFGIEVAEGDKLSTWREQAQAAGLQLRIEEQVTCCYAVADKWWVADPDGNEWEFWVRSDDAETMHGESMPMDTQSEACCAPAPNTEAPVDVAPVDAEGGACCAPPASVGRLKDAVASSDGGG